MPLFLTNEEVRKEGTVTSPLCGVERTYHLTEPADANKGRAYVNRAALEATGSPLGCFTDFEYNVTRDLEIMGEAQISFHLDCERLGLVQPSALGILNSVEASIQHRHGEETDTVGTGIWNAPGVGLCAEGVGHRVETVVDFGEDGFVVDEADDLILRLEIKAVNTEKDLLPYFFIDTDPAKASTVTIVVVVPPDDVPDCSDGIDNDEDTEIDHPADPGCTAPDDDDETDETTPPSPECSDQADNDADGKIDHPADPGCDSPQDDDETDTTTGGDEAPECSRDEPSEGEITRTAGVAFTLTAVCTDPDDDLSHGDWTVDDEQDTRDDLGDSPATAEEDFTINEPGTHVIEVTPTDQEDHIGDPATWIVHVIDDSGEGSAPECTRDEPAEFEVSVETDEAFTLSATCTDADDDMDDGDWVVDGEPTGTDDLGSSPSTVDEEFEFGDCGEHQISFVPRDLAGNTGVAASWHVTVTGCETQETEDPTPTTPIPVFPSSLAFMLATVGALGGGFLILRRRT